MSTFKQISHDFSAFGSGVQSMSRAILNEEITPVLRDLQERSPVDTGFFRSNWRVTVARFSSNNTIAAINVSNDTPYAYFMEYGAPLYSAPWYYPRQRGAKGRYRKGSGKLKGVKGRVWAGGLNPGHNLTIGGAIGPAIINSRKRANDIAKRFAEELSSRFK